MDINIDDYKVLNLHKDPFSTAPDPEFLYQSRQHFGTLQLLESSIKKEQGMSVVIGASGTGKTTICRQLYRKVAYEKTTTSKVLYAHYYENSDYLLREIAELFNYKDLNRADSIYELLVQQSIADGKSIALIIDNGHMIPEFCLSVLNRLSDLNANGRNFFQIVIFANKDLNYNIEANPDFESRIVNFRTLGPFNFRDTRQMISYRLKMAGSISGLGKNSRRRILFSYPAMLAIYLATEGYPRKIVLLCHRCMVTMILNRTIKAGWFMVRSSAKRVIKRNAFTPDAFISLAVIAMPILIVAVMLSTLRMSDISSYFHFNEITLNTSISDGVNTTQQVGESPDIEIIDNGDNPMAGAFITLKDADVQSESQIKIIDPGNIISDDIEYKIESELVIENTPEIISDSKLVELFQNPPDVIGTVEIEKSDTLLVMLEKVYGHSRARYKKAVVDANTHISNINALEIGDIINFPPIVAIINTPSEKCVWVKVGTGNKLNDTVEFTRKWRVKGHRIKIIPYFSKGNGLHFDVIVRQLFTDKTDAADFIKTLPEPIADKSEIIEFPFQNTVFFADPYLI